MKRGQAAPATDFELTRAIAASDLSSCFGVLSHFHLQLYLLEEHRDQVFYLCQVQTYPVIYCRLLRAVDSRQSLEIDNILRAGSFKLEQ